MKTTLFTRLAIPSLLIAIKADGKRIGIKADGRLTRGECLEITDILKCKGQALGVPAEGQRRNRATCNPLMETTCDANEKCVWNDELCEWNSGLCSRRQIQ